jgi:integrase
MSKDEALEELERTRAKVVLGLYEEKKRNGDSVSIKEVFEHYKRYLKRHKPHTYDGQKHMFKLFRFFHNLEEITPRDIQRYQDRRLKKVKGPTINRELEYAAASFNRAIKDKIWKGGNPFQGFEKFTETPRTRFLTQNEIVRLVQACFQVANHKSPLLPSIVVTAIGTGLRKGIILKLHERQIDFETGFIRVRATGTNKYRKDNLVPLSPTLAKIFKKHLANNQNGYVFENPYTGKPYDDVKKSFKTALKMAGIEDFRFHDLRHTYASYALLQGGDLRTVQELLGHGRVTTTEKYTHVLSQQRTYIAHQTNNFIFNLKFEVDKKVDKLEGGFRKSLLRKASQSHGDLMGFRGSEVQILSPRPVISRG